MRALRWHVVLVLVALATVVSATNAQAALPRIGYAYPAGGRQGTTFEVTVGGQYLQGAKDAYVSGGGAQVRALEYVKPVTPAQAAELRDRLRDLRQKPLDAATTQQVAEMRAKLFAFANRPGPVIAETVKLEVTIAASAAPGERELRLRTPTGLSNPLVFCVGQLTEFSAKTVGVVDPNDFRDLRGSPERPDVTQEREMTVTLPATLNGQIMPGGVDRYRFQARKGQRLVAAASARKLIPYLADAVPGWFQAALTLYDAGGNELAHADHFRFHPDPVLYYQVQQDGQYVLAIRDSIYRGRQDFVYRITVGEVPFLTGIFPLGGRAGEPTTVKMEGWNLPEPWLTLNAKDKALGVQSICARKGQWLSNPEPFAVDDMPECLAKGTSHTPETAQAVTLPIIVNGRVERPGQWEVFRFLGRAGEEVVAEVYARRGDSPLDSVLRLTDATGRELAFNDDHEDKGSGLNTHHADSYIRFRLPADGTYYLYLGDAQRQGGPECVYRLRIGSPRPDFALRAVPSSLNIRPGLSAAFMVYALRKDGFSGDIDLSLAGAPAGFTLGGGQVPENQNQVRVTLTAPTAPPESPVSLTIQGRARIQGEDVVHTVVPADDMMQAFAYRHLVPAQELAVDVSGRYMPRAAGGIISPLPVEIPVGRTARVQAEIATSAAAGSIRLRLDDPPEGISIQAVSPVRAGTEITLKADAAKAKPGMRGNLIVSIFLAPSPPASATSRPRQSARQVLLGTLPAIPFEIVPDTR